MEWGIIGAGLIGAKRAAALHSLGEKVSAVADVDSGRAEELASKYSASSFSDWKKITRDGKIGAVVVATTHDWLSPIAIDALDHGKHVLVEKPAGRNPAEVRAIINAQEKSGKQVAVGFNHRFHPAILEARKICQSGKFGKLLFMRARGDYVRVNPGIFCSEYFGEFDHCRLGSCIRAVVNPHAGSPPAREIDYFAPSRLE